MLMIIVLYLLHSERPKLYAILAFLSAVGLIPSVEIIKSSFVFYDNFSGVISILFLFRYWINICASVHGSPCSGDVGVCRQTKDGKSTDSIGRASTATGLKKGSKFGQCSWKECTVFTLNIWTD